MPENWDAIAAEVVEGIGEVGVAANIVRKGAQTGPAYNPTFGPDELFPVTIVYDEYDTDEIDGTLILATDLKIMMTAVGVVPTPADKLRADKDYSIQRVKPLQPGGTPVMWELQCRA